MTDAEKAVLKKISELYKDILQLGDIELGDKLAYHKDCNRLYVRVCARAGFRALKEDARGRQ